MGCGLIMYDEGAKCFAFLAMRRREDNVWVVVEERSMIETQSDAETLLSRSLRIGEPKEPLPSGVRGHRILGELEGRKPSDIFKLLALPSHHSAAWALNQLYLALPKPDKNFVSDFQTNNFHTRLWELYLLACFREQGIEVSQDYQSPDYQIRNRVGEAFVEAVTANPTARYNHVSSQPVLAPENTADRQLGSAAVRYAKTLYSKLQKNYHEMPHVRGKPFSIAIADFHAPSSMVWSREALPCYLYGFRTQLIEHDGEAAAILVAAERLLAKEEIPAGLFRDPKSRYLSAVIHSNAGTIAKFNRMGFLAGYRYPGLMMIRSGHLYDRTPGALTSINFAFDITSDEYGALWSDGEEWSVELDVYHNPLAIFPLPFDLLPRATHWFEQDGDVVCRAYYKNTVLASTTSLKFNEGLVNNNDDDGGKSAS